MERNNRVDGDSLIIASLPASSILPVNDITSNYHLKQGACRIKVEAILAVVADPEAWDDCSREIRR